MRSRTKGAFPMKKVWKTVAFLGTAAAFAAAGLYFFRKFFGADEDLEDFEDDDLFDENDEDEDEDDIKAFEDDSEIFEDETPAKAEEEKEEEPEEEKAPEETEEAPEA